MSDTNDDPIAQRAAALAKLLKEMDRRQNDYPHRPIDPAQDPSAFIVMSMKARRAEIEEFKAVCARLGAPPNRAMRALIREASGYIELFDEDRNGILAMERRFRDLTAIGERIARAAEETDRSDADELDRWRRDVDKRLDALRDVMGTILDVAATRADGAQRLSRSVAALDKADPSRRGKGQRKGKGPTRVRPEPASSPSRSGQSMAETVRPDTEPNAEPIRGGFKLRRPPYLYVHPSKRRRDDGP